MIILLTDKKIKVVLINFSKLKDWFINNDNTKRLNIKSLSLLLLNRG